MKILSALGLAACMLGSLLVTSGVSLAAADVLYVPSYDSPAMLDRAPACHDDTYAVAMFVEVSDPTLCDRALLAETGLCLDRVEPISPLLGLEPMLADMRSCTVPPPFSPPE